MEVREGSAILNDPCLVAFDAGGAEELAGGELDGFVLDGAEDAGGEDDVAVEVGRLRPLVVEAVLPELRDIETERLERIASEVVVLPASTWAKMPMMRTFSIYVNIAVQQAIFSGQCKWGKALPFPPEWI